MDKLNLSTATTSVFTHFAGYQKSAGWGRCDRCRQYYSSLAGRRVKCYRGLFFTSAIKMKELLSPLSLFGLSYSCSMVAHAGALLHVNKSLSNWAVFLFVLFYFFANGNTMFSKCRSFKKSSDILSNIYINLELKILLKFLHQVFYIWLMGAWSKVIDTGKPSSSSVYLDRPAVRGSGKKSSSYSTNKQTRMN